MPDYPPEALAAAALIVACQRHTGPPVDSDRKLAAEILDAAVPVLAEAWNLPALQAEHDEWRRRGVTARRIRDEYFAGIDARYPRRENSSSPVAATGED